MNEDMLFGDEQETITEGLALLASEESQDVPWRSHYEGLLGKYRKLVIQTRRLVRMGDNVQRELLRARETTEFQATHDFLTLLWNRGAIMDALGKEIARHKREKRPLGLIMADIDHFKHFNDAYGHLAGDAVLREASRRLESNVRPYDFVGRFGGEEFVVVVPGCGGQEASGIAERLRLAISQTPMETSEGVFHVTLSLGVTVVDSGREADSDSMIREADEALYRAKNGGRNQVEVSWSDAEQV
ncbi:MAG: GGDEF domain-containing protein [Pseudomonadota bacterium]